MVERVRDTKDRAQEALTFTDEEWVAFVAGVKLTFTPKFRGAWVLRMSFSLSASQRPMSW